MSVPVIAGFFDEYFWLSNFSQHSFVDSNDITWPTNEHFYQAMKTQNEEWREQIRRAETPALAKKLGRRAPMHEEWERTKEVFMMRGLRLKFSPQFNPGLREKLIETQDMVLVEENYWGDQYWGQVKGVGHNMLGKCLMILRDELMLS